MQPTESTTPLGQTLAHHILIPSFTEAISMGVGCEDDIQGIVGSLKRLVLKNPVVMEHVFRHIMSQLQGTTRPSIKAFLATFKLHSSSTIHIQEEPTGYIRSKTAEALLRRWLKR